MQARMKPPGEALAEVKVGPLKGMPIRRLSGRELQAAVEWTALEVERRTKVDLFPNLHALHLQVVELEAERQRRWRERFS